MERVQIADLCAPWKISNGGKNLVLQSLQFYEVDVCRKFLGRVSISHYRPNQFFMEG
jgi:hypothetical protein